MKQYQFEDKYLFDSIQIFSNSQANLFFSRWNSSSRVLSIRKEAVTIYGKDYLLLDILLFDEKNYKIFVVLACQYKGSSIMLYPSMMRCAHEEVLQYITNTVFSEFPWDATSDTRFFSLSSCPYNFGDLALRVERALPGCSPYITTMHHIKRYFFGRFMHRYGRLLDCACGLGYGSAILLQNPCIKQYVGVDISHEAVSFSRMMCDDERATFYAYDLQSLDHGDFDAVFSFETLEHTHDPHQFLSALAERVAPGGKAIVSAPNAKWHGSHCNPDHKSNWNYDRFKHFVSRFFDHCQIYTQRLSLLGPHMLLSSEIKRKPSFPDEDEFFIAVLRGSKKVRRVIVYEKSESTLHDVRKVLHEWHSRAPEYDTILVTQQPQQHLDNPDIDLLITDAFKLSESDRIVELSLQGQAQPVSDLSSHQLKITFLTPGTSISGGVKVIFEYCNRLASNGHKITLAALSGEKPDWFILDRRVQFIKTVWNDESLLLDLPDADIIFATFWLTAYYVDRLPGSKGMKFYLVQDYESQTIASPKDADPTYSLPLHKIVVSTWLGKLLRDRFLQDSKVITNGIDESILFPEPEVRRNFPVDSIRIGMLYHTEIRKSINYGLEAFQRVKETFPQAKMIMYGTVSPEISVADEFYLNITAEEVRKYFCSLDLFLSCSIQEGFGLPGLEAMACGVPLVTTDSGGTSEYAINEETALVVPPADSYAMAQAVCRVISDGLLREHLRMQGQDMALRFSWQKSVDAMLTTLRAAVLNLSAENSLSQEKINYSCGHQIQKIVALERQVETLSSSLQAIYSSRGWRALKIYYKIRDVIKNLHKHIS